MIPRYSNQDTGTTLVLISTATGAIVLHAPHQQHDHDHDDDRQCSPAKQAGSFSDYRKRGIRFQFPSDWVLTEHSNEHETTITVQSDGTSFWTLMLFNSRPDPDTVLDTVVEAFEQDYEEVDVLAAIGGVSGLPALGRDLDFVCYDLVNSAIVRAFQTSEQTVMVLYQGTDHELKSTRTQLEAITSSLQCDDDDGIDVDLEI